MNRKTIGVIDWVIGGLWVSHGIRAMNDESWIAAHTELVTWSLIMLGVMYVLLGIYVMNSGGKD